MKNNIVIKKFKSILQVSLSLMLGYSLICLVIVSLILKGMNTHEIGIGDAIVFGMPILLISTPLLFKVNLILMDVLLKKTIVIKGEIEDKFFHKRDKVRITYLKYSNYAIKIDIFDKNRSELKNKTSYFEIYGSIDDRFDK